jgi:hypothetical protein
MLPQIIMPYQMRRLYKVVLGKKCRIVSVRQVSDTIEIFIIHDKSHIGKLELNEFIII